MIFILSLRRHVKKICQWHIFSVDLSGYAAVASFLVCTASSFSPDLGGYAAVADTSLTEGGNKTDFRIFSVHRTECPHTAAQTK